jgi:5-formyltetrahydrofolate cyclo-ligase
MSRNAMTEPAPLSRPQLRRMLRNARRALTPSEQRQAALGLYRQLAQHRCFAGPNTLLYLPTTVKSIRACCCAKPSAGARPLTCRCSAPGRGPRWCSSASTRRKARPNRFRILEPRVTVSRQRKVWALDLVLLPLVGLMMWADAWAWAAASTTAAWRTWRAANLAQADAAGPGP